MMKKFNAATIALVFVIIIICACFFKELAFSNEMTVSKNVQSNSDVVLTSAGYVIPSPSGKYLLSLESYDDNGVLSFKVVVTSDEIRLISDEHFRARDTFYALWDDELDRVWVYSGDLGTFFWDICNKSMKVHSYTDSEGVNAPKTLKDLKPYLFDTNGQ